MVSARPDRQAATRNEIGRQRYRRELRGVQVAAARSVAPDHLADGLLRSVRALSRASARRRGPRAHLLSLARRGRRLPACEDGLDVATWSVRTDRRVVAFDETLDDRGALGRTRRRAIRFADGGAIFEAVTHRLAEPLAQRARVTRCVRAARRIGAAGRDGTAAAGRVVLVVVAAGCPKRAGEEEPAQRARPWRIRGDPRVRLASHVSYGGRATANRVSPFIPRAPGRIRHAVLAVAARPFPTGCGPIGTPRSPWAPQDSSWWRTRSENNAGETKTGTSSEEQVPFFGHCDAQAITPCGARIRSRPGCP